MRKIPTDIEKLYKFFCFMIFRSHQQFTAEDFYDEIGLIIGYDKETVAEFFTEMEQLGLVEKSPVRHYVLTEYGHDFWVTIDNKLQLDKTLNGLRSKWFSEIAGNEN